MSPRATFNLLFHNQWRMKAMGQWCAPIVAARLALGAAGACTARPALTPEPVVAAERAFAADFFGEPPCNGEASERHNATPPKARGRAQNAPQLAGKRVLASSWRSGWGTRTVRPIVSLAWPLRRLSLKRNGSL